MAMFTIVRRFSPRNICLTRAFLSLKPRENYAASIFAAKSRCYSHPVSHDELRTMTKSEWEERLTPEQFSVCREQCTEPPFSGEFNSHYEKGMYTCVCCGTDLFSSKSKYDSGTGWPSFSDAYKSDKGLSNIIERPENSLDQSTFRTEGFTMSILVLKVGSVFPYDL
ncbi:MSRB2-like protein, partial [Mya arenaria]